MTDAAPVPPPTSAQPVIRRGFIKEVSLVDCCKHQLEPLIQVLSGDAVVLQGKPVNGPPPESAVYLSGITAPRLGKRPREGVPTTPDEPWAWEAREFLRKKLAGQMVTFIRDFTASSGRDHGRIYLGGTNVDNAENVTESAVAEGLLEVRVPKITDDYSAKLMQLQENAKASGKGKWSSQPAAIREVKWVIENPRALVDNYAQKPVEAIVEQVRDGTTLRVLLVPSYEYVTLQLSGVRSPATRLGADGIPEPFAEEAKFFVEQRLLHQDIKVVLESTSNQNVVGSVLHEKGNIAESLLREGYAKCVDWSIGLCTGGAEKLRAAEKFAKEKKLRLWKNYQPSAGLSADKRTFEAKVLEVVMNDALIVQKDDGTELKVHLSSIRLPRDDANKPVGRNFRPLYDVPFMFQAREFLRKRVIGKRVSVTVDYIQPKSENYPEKTCCTVLSGDLNLAEALLSKGLSKVVTHRSDDENRSSEYDTLLTANSNAEKAKKGLWADKSVDKKDTLRIQELQGDLAKSKQFLPYLQRTKRVEGVVEFIASGSRLRVYVPKETVIVTFLLGGISCPRSARAGPGGVNAQSEPFADEAAQFTRRLCLQHEVELEVEGVDKMGNFIGYIFVPPTEGSRPQNLSELLLEQGLATLHFTAEKSGHYVAMQSAEARARNAKRNMWENYKEEVVIEEVEAQQNDVAERKVNYKTVTVTDVQQGSFRFSAQLVEDGPRVERMTADLRSELHQNPPMTGSYNARRGELCVSKFSLDGQWYRARVETIKAGQADVLYVDYGNRETVAATSLAALPASFASFPPAAKEYGLGLAAIPNDKAYGEMAVKELHNMLFSCSTADINVDYRVGTTEYVQVLIDVNGKKLDVAKALIEDGFALVEKRREQRLQELATQYQEAEKSARKYRMNIWEFGDFTGNEI